MKRILSVLALLLALCMSFTGCDLLSSISTESSSPTTSEAPSSSIETPSSSTEPEGNTGNITLDSIPAYSTSPYVYINNGVPSFTAEEITITAYEFYSELDSLGRCGYTMACIGKEIMPTEDRGSISSVYPTGWIQAQYDCVDGTYLYNRCHLIGFQLTGENANKKNLITGTKYLNNEGMLPLENMIADYIKETNNHVMYRVTPIFKGNNLLASGVHIEAYSVEDEGDGICMNVYVYNVQPGVAIDYATGASALSGEPLPETPPDEEQSSSTTGEQDYTLNTNTKKFHNPSCSSAQSTSEQNKQQYHGTREDLIAQGYSACGVCNP